MDFGTAYARLRAGEKIRRGIWWPVDGTVPERGITRWGFLYIEQREGYAPALMVRHGDGGSGHFVLIDEHLLAEDWEIV